MAFRVAFNSCELNALAGLPLAAQVIYMRGIRPHMDYVTGIVGVRSEKTKRISYQSLSEVIYVEPVTGRDKQKKQSIRQLRVLVDWLVRSGLVVRLSTYGTGNNQLILKCILADTDESAQNKDDIELTGVKHQKDDIELTGSKVNCSNASSVIDDAKDDIELTGVNHQKDDTPPVTGFKTNKQTTRVREKLIPDDFELTDVIRMRALMYGLSVDLLESLFPEFVLKNKKRQWLSRDWDMEFIRYCKKIDVEKACDAGRAIKLDGDAANGFVTMGNYDDRKM